MYMGDDYYLRQIEGYENNMRIASMCMDICVSLIDFKNDRFKQKVSERVSRLKSAELDKASAVRNKLASDISKVNHSSYISYSKIEDLIDSLERKYRLDLDYSKKSSLAIKIAKDPVAALRDFSYSYIDAKRNIANTKQRQAEDKKEEEQRKRDREKEAMARRQPVVEDTYTPTSTIYAPVNTPRSNKPFTATSIEESKKLVEAKIDEEIANKYGTMGFSYEEEKRIKELYPELDSYNGYYSVKTLEQGLTINNISSKKDIKLDDIMELGLLTFDVVTKELLEGDRKISQPGLFSKLGMKSTLEKYNAAYAKFMNYYRGLDASQREGIKQQIESNRRYATTFGTSIATPDYMKSRINHAVSRHIIERHAEFYGYDKQDFYSRTLSATKYMSVEEITSLYKGLKDEYTKYGIYAENDEERHRQEQARFELLAKLQEDYARVILTRLGKYNGKVDYKNMSEEEELRRGEEYQKKIAAICVDVFNEKPLSSSLSEVARREDVAGKGDNLVQSFEVKKQAEARVFGLSKAKLAFAKMSGKWSRYLMLMDKEDLTKKEQEELNSLFR